ncbi:MAG: DUF58 domain-containing protein [Phycisphaerales bacterium]|nr:DUF58 domain-containing protein [Phycisphaerales bacterium]
MISDELLKQVRLLQLRSRRAVNEVFAGEYSSAFKGRGMEFAEVRQYQPGDEIRTIDWNVTARTGEPYIKRFVEERELTLMFVVDMSGSSEFGSERRLKRETAAEICALLGYAALANNDKVGLVIFSDRVENYVPPKKGQNHTLRVVRELLEFNTEPEGKKKQRKRGRCEMRRGTNGVAALEHLGKVLKRKAIVVFVSDFLFGEAAGDEEVEKSFETALRLIARRHDLVTVHVADPREMEMTNAGMIELEDPETGARAWVDAGSKRVRNAFGALARRHEAQVRERSRRAGADHLFVRTDRPYVHDLVQLFHRREKRR